MAHLKMQLIAVLFMVSVLVVRSEPVATRGIGEWNKNADPCSGQAQKQEICQRCAKQTKSPIVYPMCCNNEDLVYEWCYQYVHYDGQMR